MKYFRKGGFQDDDAALKPLLAQSFLSLRQVYCGLANALEAIAQMHKSVLKQVKEQGHSFQGATALTGRLTRNVRNHVEGLALFAPLVLIASVTGVSNT